LEPVKAALMLAIFEEQIIIEPLVIHIESKATEGNARATF
jgi:hypothetical protein